MADSFTMGVGWLGVLIALMCWGTFSSLTKTARMRELNVQAAVLQVYVGVAVFFTSFLVLLRYKLEFSAWGLLGAGLWVPGNCGFFYSIRALGLGAAVGVCAGSVCLGGFLWGLLGTSVWGDPPCHMDSPGGAAFGTALLCLSIGALAYCGSEKEQSQERCGPVPSLAQQDALGATMGPEAVDTGCPSPDVHNEDGDTITVAIDQSSLASTAQIHVSTVGTASSATNATLPSDAALVGGSLSVPRKPSGQTPGASILQVASAHGMEILRSLSKGHSRVLHKLLWVGATVVFGLMGGTLMVPAYLAKHQHGVEGIQYMLSFGIGTGVATAILAMIVQFQVLRTAHASDPADRVQWFLKDAILPGLSSGTLWNLGNFGSLLASFSPLGSTVGYPVTQANLLIAGLLAIFWFKEVKDRRRVLGFFASCCTVITGAVLLANFGKCGMASA